MLFDGRDLAKLSEREMSAVRGNAIAMIFQEPMTSLNPTMTVGEQIAEAIIIHRGGSRAAAMAEALRLLKEVKIPSAESRMHDYPHQFSGGMRQRVMIAMALACRPKILLADEPTTALDVTIQAQVLMQLDELKQAYGMSVLFITHNLGVVAQIADRVAVMYAGEVVELAAVEALFARPMHPYTEALLRAMPRADRDSDSLEPIPGSVPAADRDAAGLRLCAALPVQADKLRGAAAGARCPPARPGIWCAVPCGLQRRRAHDVRIGRRRARGPQSRQALRHRRRAVRAGSARSCAPSTTCPSRCRGARRSASSANPAAASRRWRAPCCA